MFPLSPAMCRICALEGDDNEPLFEPTGATSEVGTIFYTCLAIQLQLDDGYPQTICFRCNTQLRMFYEFRRGALRMHQKITETLQKLQYVNAIKAEDTSSETAAVQEAVVEPTEQTQRQATPSLEVEANDSADVKPFSIASEDVLAEEVEEEEEEDEQQQQHVEDVQSVEADGSHDDSNASVPVHPVSESHESEAADEHDADDTELTDNDDAIDVGASPAQQPAESANDEDEDEDEDDDNDDCGGQDDEHMDVMYLDEDILYDNNDDDDDDGEEEEEEEEEDDDEDGDIGKGFDPTSFSVEPADGGGAHGASDDGHSPQLPFVSRAKRRGRTTDGVGVGTEDTVPGMPCKQCGKVFKRLANLQKHVCQRLGDLLFR